jgi:hypothetical protein
LYQQSVCENQACYEPLDGLLPLDLQRDQSGLNCSRAEFVLVVLDANPCETLLVEYNQFPTPVGPDVLSVESRENWQRKQRGNNGTLIAS